MFLEKIKIVKEFRDGIVKIDKVKFYFENESEMGSFPATMFDMERKCVCHLVKIKSNVGYYYES